MTTDSRTPFAEPVSEIDLMGWIDGQLDPARRLAVEAHLARNPEAAAAAMAELHRHDLLRLAMAGPEGSPAPRSRALARQLGRGLARDRFWLHGRRIAAVALLFGLGWLSHAGFGPFAVRQSVASAAPPAFVSAALSAHDAAAIRARLALQPAVPDLAGLRAATGITLPQLPEGWQLADVQILPSPLGPSVEMEMLSPELGAISLYAVRQDSFDVTPPHATEGRTSEGRPAAIAWYQVGEIAQVLVAEDAAPEALRSRAAELLRSLY